MKSFIFYCAILLVLIVMSAAGASPDAYDRLAKETGEPYYDEDYGSFDEDRKLPPYHRGGKRLRRRHLGGWWGWGKWYNPYWGNRWGHGWW